MVKAKSRIATATAVIFVESSILNEEFSTSARKSSSEPEIIGALTALQKAINLNFKNIVITSDSTSAIKFIKEIFDDEVKSQIFKNHMANKQFSHLARSAESASINVKYLAAIHTRAHQGMNAQNFSN